MPSNSKQSADLRRLGTILLLGVVAGYGARYVASRVSRGAAGGPTRLIDWGQARTFALRVSQWEQANIADRAARRQQYTRLVERSEPLIAEYLGVPLPEPINRVYVVDRREWLEANFSSFAVIFAPVEELYQRLGARQSGLGAALGQINGRIIGAQMGILLLLGLLWRESVPDVAFWLVGALMAAGSAGVKSYTRQALPTVILCWTSWGRWSSHLPAMLTVSGQVESEWG
jgi:hypothetical protein